MEQSKIRNKGMLLKQLKTRHAQPKKTWPVQKQINGDPDS